MQIYNYFLTRILLNFILTENLFGQDRADNARQLSQKKFDAILTHMLQFFVARNIDTYVAIFCRGKY